MSSYNGIEKPERYPLPVGDDRTYLRSNVIKALSALPMHFTSPIIIEGIDANDLFSINTLLGGSIETQTVTILNSLRSVWDPKNQWPDKEFRRFPESYPDVRLVGSDGSSEPLIGIELKGWYLLSKESEPSLRFKAASDANTVWDLVCCVPWGLSNVLSGKPVVYEPFVEQAKYAADMRTYYWHHRKGSGKARNCNITHPTTNPYPKPGSQYIDCPEYDGGNNFGRLARIDGLMTEWIMESINTKMAGIEAKYWISFFRLFSEGKTSEQIEEELEGIARKVRTELPRTTDNVRKEEELLAHLAAIVEMSKR